MKTIATIGTFDGVHTGHTYLLRQLEKIAEEEVATPLVFVLTPHPLAVIDPERAPKLLSMPLERVDKIKEILPNAEVQLFPFTEASRHLTHREFMRMLRDNYSVSTILLGHDNRFGCDVCATFEDYQASAELLGMQVYKCSELPDVNSSNIRTALAEGRLSEANKMLGSLYCVSGVVQQGNRLGRTIDFPTANLNPNNSEKLIPARGVYAAFASFEDLNGQPVAYKAIVNIGVRPTIVKSEDSPVTVEAHLLDFHGDLYGKTINLLFHSRLRDEKPFSSLNDLALQLHLDAEKAIAVLPDAEKFLRKSILLNDKNYL